MFFSKHEYHSDHSFGVKTTNLLQGYLRMQPQMGFLDMVFYSRSGSDKNSHSETQKHGCIPKTWVCSPDDAFDICRNQPLSALGERSRASHVTISKRHTVGKPISAEAHVKVGAVSIKLFSQALHYNFRDVYTLIETEGRKTPYRKNAVQMVNTGKERTML